MDNVPVICRLCLKFTEEDGYAPLQKNNSVLQSLNLISFSTIKNLQLTKNPVICKCCSNKLTELATFKEKIIANEFKIQCNKKNDPKAFLCSISEDINKICRLCLKVPIDLKDLLMSWKDSKLLLHSCNIHLNNDIAIPSKICINCDKSLKKLGEFIVECTYNEKKIFNCASEKGMLDSNQLIKLFKIDSKKNIRSGNTSRKNNIMEDKSHIQVINEDVSNTRNTINKNLTISELTNADMSKNNQQSNNMYKLEKHRTYRSANSSTLKINVSKDPESISKELQEMLSASTNNIDTKQPSCLDVTLGSKEDYNASDNGLQDLIDILDNQNEIVDKEEPNIFIEECNDECIIMNIQLQSILPAITCENENSEQNNFNGEIEIEIDFPEKTDRVPEESGSGCNNEINVVPTDNMETYTEKVSPTTSKFKPRNLRTKRKRSISATRDVPLRRKNLKLELEKKINNDDKSRVDTKNNVKSDKHSVKEGVIKKKNSVTPKKVGRPAKRRGRPPKPNKTINKKEENQPEVSNDNIVSIQDQSSSSEKLSEPENATTSNADTNKKALSQTNAKPFEVTIIRRTKRTTNKADIDKTWEKLTGKSVDEPKAAPVKVLKKRGRKPNPNKVVPVKAEYFICACCPFKTISQNSFVQHQYIHNVLDNVASFKCKDCHFKTSNEELLKQHEATHSAATLLYKCIFCDYSNHKKKISIMNHILRHDDKDVANMFYCAVVNQDTMDEYFECFQCDFQHPEEAVMPDHVIDHSRAVKIKNPLVAKFECNFCMYRTKTEELLERHKELKHSKQNKLGSEENMIKVKEEAPEDGLFKCDLCSYMTFHKRSLANHKSRKHFRKPSEKKETGETYYCAECSYTTHRKVNLARHALVHKTKRNMEFYECTHCYFETKHRRSYTRHMEVRHQVIV